MYAFRMAKTFRICKLSEKDIRSSRFADYMTKDYICYIFHRRQNKKWTRYFTPKIFFHIYFNLLIYYYLEFLSMTILPQKLDLYKKIINFQKQLENSLSKNLLPK